MAGLDVVDAVHLAAEELYALVPGDFTARRDALVKELRGSGDRESAKAVSALRRPTVTAWVVNQLARTGDLDDVLALGEQLREAQGALDAPRMKDLGRERTRLVQEVLRRADGRAQEHDQTLGAGPRREVEETVVAALADPEAASAVASGRLTRALSYAGFGEVDLSDAVATPLAEVVRLPVPDAAREERPARAPAQAPTPREQPAQPAKAGPTAAERRAAEKEARAVQALADAEAALERSRDAHVQARRQAEEAAAEEESAEDEVADLTRRLAHARSRLTAATKARTAADNARTRARRAERDALAALDRLGD